MKKEVMPSHALNVSNTSTAFFLIRSIEIYNEYIKKMLFLMENRFYDSINDKRYMEGIIGQVMENANDGFPDYLAKNEQGADVDDVCFDEVRVNLRRLHNILCNQYYTGGAK